MTVLVSDPMTWRASVGEAPWAEATLPLAAHAPAALQAAAQRLHQRTQGEEPVAQIAYLEAAHVGASVALTGAQGSAVAARVKAVEHIFDAGQAITRLELEAAAD